MKTYVPSIYPRFRCLMGDCRHSCCRGWEIDIDESSLARYEAMPGPLGEKLRENILKTENGACFRLDEGERCPFLQQDGLCQLIKEAGEESLCQICADHPRFRNFYTDRVEMGLGLCCEGAALLLLSWEDTLCWQPLSQEEEEEAECTPEEARFFRSRDRLISLLQDRSRPMDERAGSLLSLMRGNKGMEQGSFLSLMMGMEHMDESWPQLLERLQRRGDLAGPLPAQAAIPLEQLLWYFLQRHLPASVEDGMYEAWFGLCMVCYLTVRGLWAMHYEETGALSLQDMAEYARLFSGEIEYSDENIEKLLQFIAREPEC